MATLTFLSVHQVLEGGHLLLQRRRDPQLVGTVCDELRVETAKTNTPAQWCKLTGHRPPESTGGALSEMAAFITKCFHVWAGRNAAELIRVWTRITLQVLSVSQKLREVFQEDACLDALENSREAAKQPKAADGCFTKLSNLKCCVQCGDSWGPP